MTDRTYHPDDPDVIRVAAETGKTPEFVVETMNGPTAARVHDAIGATADTEAISAACDALLERVVPAFGGAIMEAMMEGYRLGFVHGVRSTAAATDPAAGLMDVIRRTHEAATTPPPSGAVPHPLPDYPASAYPSDVRAALPAFGQQIYPMTAELRALAGGHRLCWWACNGCGRGRVLPLHVRVPQEAEEARAHQSACPAYAEWLGAGEPVPTPVDGLVRRAAEGALAGDLGPAEELAREMHPSAFEDEQASAGDMPTDRLAPAGWDKIEAGEEIAVTVGRSLDGELIDMTAAVFAYANEHNLRRWQCRHCGRGRVMGRYKDVPAHEEGREATDHENHCDYAGASVDG